jgi:hypothetical protein
MSNTSTHQGNMTLPRGFDAALVHDTSHVVDVIGVRTECCKGILALVFSHFEMEERLSWVDRHILSALSTAMLELDDIEAALRLHLDAVREGGEK